MKKLKRKQKKIINNILTLALLVFVCSFLYSFYKIYTWHIDNINTNKKVDEIKKLAIEIINDNSTESKKINFEKVLEKNNEVVGWLQVSGTDINYPYVKHNNNSYYLTHSFDKSNNDAGWIFLDYRNNINFEDKNTIIYAHNRIDGSMFGSLKNTLKEEWYNNQNNHIITIETLSNTFTFQVFSIYIIETTDDYLDINMQEGYDLLINRSIYNFDIQVTNEDKILTLSTCYNNQKKLVLHAKLINKI